MALRILGVQLVLNIPAPDEPAQRALLQDDAARLARIFLDRLPADRLELFGVTIARAPPASAGMIATSSPSLRGVRSPWRDSIASLLT